MSLHALTRSQLVSEPYRILSESEAAPVGGTAAPVWMGKPEKPDSSPVHPILICCVTLGRRRPLSGHWTPPNSRTCQLEQPTGYPLSSAQVQMSSSFRAGRFLTKEFSSLAHFLSTSQVSGLSLLGQMVCEQEFQTNFNIQSNVIGIINLKEKNNALQPISIGSCHFLIPPA